MIKGYFGDFTDLNTSVPDFSANYYDVPVVDEIVVTAAAPQTQPVIPFENLSNDFASIAPSIVQLPTDLNTAVANFAVQHAGTTNPLLQALLNLLKGLHFSVKSGNSSGGLPSGTTAAGAAAKPATTQNNVALDLGIAAVLAVSLAVIIKNRSAQ